MKTETIHPAENLSGQLQLPGDKSISHRYAMIAALADGTSELRNFTSGTASFSMEPSHYAPVKEELADLREKKAS